MSQLYKEDPEVNPCMDCRVDLVRVAKCKGLPEDCKTWEGCPKCGLLTYWKTVDGARVPVWEKVKLSDIEFVN